MGGSSGELTVQIQTFDGSATVDDDYAGIPTPLTLTWADGNTTNKTVTLPILNDALPEGDETFTVVIGSSTNPDWVGTPSTATVTISDAPPGTIQFGSDTYSVNENDGSVILEINRVGGSSGELTVQIQTFDGSATVDDDYAGVPTPLTLTWADGNTTNKTVTLPILNDALPEGDETFTVVIGSSTNPDWVGTPSTATVTISDAPPGTIQFGSDTYSVNENDGSVILEINRVGGSSGELTVQIQTFDGSATVDDDYAGVPTPLTLTWADGNTTNKTVTLPILNDALPEGDETFTVVIGSSTNPDWVGTPSTATVTISDVTRANVGMFQTMDSDIPVSNISACNDQGNDFPFDDTFTADVTVSYTSRPNTGNLVLSGDGVGSVPVGSIGSGSYTFQNVVMSANGTPINLTVSFSDAPDCTLNNGNLGSAPAPCSGSFCVVAAITTTNISACDDQGTADPLDDTFTADVTVGFTNIPTTGSLNVTGDGTVSVPVSDITGSSYTFTGVVMSSDGGFIRLTAQFSENLNCNLTNTQAGVAPESCSVFPPVINCPLDLTVQEGESTAPADTGTPTATGGIGAVEITSEDTIDGQVITRTWTASDSVGNSAECNQTITVEVPTVLSILRFNLIDADNDVVIGPIMEWRRVGPCTACRPT